jgi:hypothetical protein
MHIIDAIPNKRCGYSFSDRRPDMCDKPAVKAYRKEWIPDKIIYRCFKHSANCDGLVGWLRVSTEELLCLEVVES